MSAQILRGVTPKDLRDVYAQALALGCTAEITGGNHVRIRLPGGGSMCGPLTSSDRRGALNVRTRLRHRGLDL